MNTAMETYLLTKYGEKRYNLNSYWLKRSLDNLEDEYANFLFDYCGAFDDCDFLRDVIIWKKLEEEKNEKP